MNRSNCSVKFFLNERVKDPIKGSPIYCRIIINRRKAEFATDEFCKPNKWDKKNGTPNRSPRIKEYLTYLENEIFDIKRKLEYQKEQVTAKILKRSYKSHSQDEVLTLLKYFDQFIDRVSQLKEDYSKARVSKYRTSRKYLTNFLSSIQSKDIPIQNFDLQKIEDYDLYLSTKIINPANQKTLSRNTVNTHHRLIKAVLNDAYKKELINRNPYLKFTLKDKESDRTFLTDDELDAIKSVDCSDNQKLERVKDIFIFSCYTGLRFSDAQNLTTDNITIDSKEGSPKNIML